MIPCPEYEERTLKYVNARPPHEPMDLLWLDRPGAMRPKTTKAARKRARYIQKLARRKNRGK